MDTNDSGYKYVVKEVPVPTVDPPSSDDLDIAVSPTPPSRSSHAVILAEMAAVLAIGIIPDCCGSCVSLWRLQEGANPAIELAWIDMLSATTINSCITIAVLFLMYRSGEPLSHFGLSRPRWLDLPIGFGLCCCSVLTWKLISPVFDPAMLIPGPVVPAPRDEFDFLLIVMRTTTGVLSEEVVNRSYLVTRLEQLSRSKIIAMIVSSILFASYHIYQGLPGFCLAFLFGLQAAGCFLFTRRIWPAAIGHLLYNSRIHLQILT